MGILNIINMPFKIRKTYNNKNAFSTKGVFILSAKSCYNWLDKRDGDRYGNLY